MARVSTACTLREGARRLTVSGGTRRPRRSECRGSDSIGLCAVDAARSNGASSSKRRGVLLACGLALVPGSLRAPPPAQALEGDDTQEDQDERFTLVADDTRGFQMLVPAESQGWKEDSKPGSTFYITDGSLFGSNSVGVTVNPVKVRTLSAFGTVDDVWDKLRGAEDAKESTKSVELLQSSELKAQGGKAGMFRYEYVLDSTRGRKHIFNTVVITGGQLYILNAQCKDKDTDESRALAADLQRTWDSFVVNDRD